MGPTWERGWVGYNADNSESVAGCYAQILHAPPFVAFECVLTVETHFESISFIVSIA